MYAMNLDRTLATFRYRWKGEDVQSEHEDTTQTTDVTQPEAQSFFFIGLVTKRPLQGGDGWGSCP